LRLIEVLEHRRVDAGFQLDLQLKSTTRATVDEAQVVYDLEVRGYESLRDLRPQCPRILVLLVLPADEAQWLSQSHDELILRHCAYWLPLQGFPPTQATRSVRVTIPLADVFSVVALQAMMKRIQERQDP